MQRKEEQRNNESRGNQGESMKTHDLLCSRERERIRGDHIHIHRCKKYKGRPLKRTSNQKMQQWLVLVDLYQSVNCPPLSSKITDKVDRWYRCRYIETASQFPDTFQIPSPSPTQLMSTEYVAVVPGEIDGW